jgi:arylsulfatase A-like enzyme
MVIASPHAAARSGNKLQFQLGTLVGALLCGLLMIAGTGCSSRTDHNLILISFDTLRADHVGLYGYPRDTSPCLDAIGRDAVVFDMTIAQAASTAPSHRSLFLSRLPSTQRQEDPFLAELLAEVGYSTAAFTGGGYVSAKLGFDRGFASYFESRGSPNDLREVYPRAESWLREHAGDEEPFFLFLHFFDVHHPYTAPQQYEDLFSPDYDGAIAGRDTGPILKGLRRLEKEQAVSPADVPPAMTLAEAERERIVALYDGGIRHADAHLGKLQRLLQELGLWDETILVILSDHGEELWDHGSILHSRQLYQEILRVPLVIRLPHGSHGGTRVTAPVRLLDVAPTILDLLGLTPFPRGYQGRSLLQLITGSESDQVLPEPFISSAMARRAAIQWPWKIIRDGKLESYEMYNLEEDPLEQHDRGVGNQENASAHYQRIIERIGLPVFRPSSTLPTPSPTPPIDDPELTEKLRALGYLD